MPPVASRTEVFTQVAVTSLLINAGLALVQLQLVAKVAGIGEAVFFGLIEAVLLVATYSQVSRVFELPDTVWVEKPVFREILIVWVIAAVFCGALQLLAIVASGHALVGSVFGPLIQLPFAISIRRKMFLNTPRSP